MLKSAAASPAAASNNSNVSKLTAEMQLLRDENAALQVQLRSLRDNDRSSADLTQQLQAEVRL